MQSTPSISIIIALRDRATTLQQCLDSVKQQSHVKRELIVIDAGSTDGSMEILQSNSDSISYWVSEPDNGIYSAWNKGLVRATGDWVCFLGADDYLWDHDVLARMATVLQNLEPEIQVCYGKAMLLQENGERLYAIGRPWPEVKSLFRQIMAVPHPGLMHRRTMFEHSGLFDESYRIAGDYELLLRELAQGEAVFVPDLIVCGMRQGGVSSSQTNGLLALKETRRAQLSHGIHTLGWTYLDALARIRLKMLLQKTFSATTVSKLIAAVRQLKKRVAE